MGPAKGDHSPSKALDISMLLDQAPVKPAHLVILAIGIVVAALGSAELVAPKQHGNSTRNKQRQQEIFDQAGSHALDYRIPAGPLHAAIVAVVSVVSIAAKLAVFVIVLLPVAHQIVQCEPIMASNKVKAACRAFA